MPMVTEKMISGHSFRPCHVDWNLTGARVVLVQPEPRPFRGLSRSLC